MLVTVAAGGGGGGSSGFLDSRLVLEPIFVFTLSLLSLRQNFKLLVSKSLSWIFSEETERPGFNPKPRTQNPKP